ncbi:hypothetical protein [Microcoleus sp. T3_D1]|uniref:hypothetical protein n=1 Tax=Microcoleus sp. T3_D1 TaxID=3055427 RepID=UPI002FD69409
MPVPQENSLFVEQASCLFLRMVQDVIFNGFNRRKSIQFYLPKQKAPLFLGALFVKSN